MKGKGRITLEATRDGEHPENRVSGVPELTATRYSARSLAVKRKKSGLNYNVRPSMTTL